MICVSETWLMPEDPDNSFFLQHYTLIRADRSTRGGGVAIYIRANIKFEIVYSQLTTEYELEQLWIKVHIQNKKIGVGVVYKPPKVNVSSFEQVSTVLEDLSLEVDSIILTGDININLLDETAINTKTFNTFISNLNLKQLIKSPTRISNATETLIDVICVSENINVIESNTLDLCNITDNKE